MTRPLTVSALGWTVPTINVGLPRALGPCVHGVGHGCYGRMIRTPSLVARSLASGDSGFRDRGLALSAARDISGSDVGDDTAGI